jgi:hypothetical protein
VIDAQDASEWRAWVKENYARGVTHSVIIAALADHGIRPQDLGIAVAATATLPETRIEASQERGGGGTVQEPGASGAVGEDIADGSATPPVSVEAPPPPLEVDGAIGMTADIFRHRHLEPGWPVRILDFSVGGAATWVPEQLWAVLGETPVEISLSGHRREVPCSWYIEFLVVRKGPAKARMTVRNQLLAAPAAQVLWRQLNPDARFVAPATRKEQSALWLQPQDTVTDLHQDPRPQILSQLWGRQRICLIPPEETPRMYAEGLGSHVDIRTPDPDRFPLFGGVRRADFTLDAAEAVFIPSGWWRAMATLDPCVYLTFTVPHG